MAERNIARELESSEVLRLNWSSRKTDNTLKLRVKIAALDSTVLWFISLSRTEEQFGQQYFKISISFSLLKSFDEIKKISSAKILGAP
jgi:hypothetical protein